MPQKEPRSGSQEGRFGSWLCPLRAASSRAPTPKVGGDDGNAVLFCQVILIFSFPSDRLVWTEHHGVGDAPATGSPGSSSLALGPAC